MARITGVIYIDFETDKPITKEQFKDFNKKINNDLEEVVDNYAAECGFESETMHSILLDELDCEYDS